MNSNKFFTIIIYRRYYNIFSCNLEFMFIENLAYLKMIEKF